MVLIGVEFLSDVLNRLTEEHYPNFLKVKDRLGAVYFSSEVSWLDSAHQGGCVKEN